MEVSQWLNQKTLKISAIVVLVLLIISVYFFNTGYAVKLDDKVIGLVKSKNDITNTIENIKEDYKEKLNKEIDIPQNITYEKVFALGKAKLTENEIKSEIEKSVAINVEAYKLNVDGKDIGILNDDKEAEKLLNDIKTKYVEEDSEIKEAGFVENVDIVKTFVSSNEIQTVDTIDKLITTGTNETKTYVVKEGDTISHISKKYGMSTKDIEKANPEINVDNIKIGQVISLTVPKPLINVKVVKETKYEDNIPYQREYKESSSMYKGDSKVQVKGKEGKKEVLAEITYINGIEEDKNIIEEKILQEPKNEVVLKGTKERPKTLAYGSFIQPTRGSLTSRFGPRWGSKHTGIDIGIPTGTPVKAADGGKVISAGWAGNYGNLIIIDHENGYKTYYAHNSKLKVKKGDRVYRGQVISYSGATGNVTGPHLHFEVRKNGVPINPLGYVSY